MKALWQLLDLFNWISSRNFNEDFTLHNHALDSVSKNLKCFCKSNMTLLLLHYSLQGNDILARWEHEHFFFRCPGNVFNYLILWLNPSVRHQTQGKNDNASTIVEQLWKFLQLCMYKFPCALHVAGSNIVCNAQGMLMLRLKVAKLINFIQKVPRLD